MNYKVLKHWGVAVSDFLYHKRHQTELKNNTLKFSPYLPLFIQTDNIVSYFVHDIPTYYCTKNRNIFPLYFRIFLPTYANKIFRNTDPQKWLKTILYTMHARPVDGDVTF